MGELVPEPTRLQVGDKVFVPIILGKSADGKKPRIKKFTQRELRFLDKLIQTRDFQISAEEVGIDIQTAKKWVRKTHFRAYMQDAYRRAALAQGIDAQEHIAWLRAVRDGFETPNDMAMEASKQLSRFLRPSAPTVVNASQTIINNGSAAPSPFKGMSREQLAGEMGKRLEILRAMPKGSQA
jgi:hypothetical protein